MKKNNKTKILSVEDAEQRGMTFPEYRAAIRYLPAGRASDKAWEMGLMESSKQLINALCEAGILESVQYEGKWLVCPVSLNRYVIKTILDKPAPSPERMAELASRRFIPDS